MATRQSRSTGAVLGSLLLVVGVGLFLQPDEAQARDNGCHRRLKTAVMPLMNSGISGEARLCVRQSGVNGRLDVEHLVPGDAYTVWFVYFDDPAQCVGGGPGICGDADFGGAKPLGVFGRYDSAIGPRSGQEEFDGGVRGFRPREGSQVWLLMFGHGPADMADRSRLARQLLTPEDPAAGAPHLGNVVDGSLGRPAAIAIFNIP
jgi:hypothetical protein